MALFIRQDENKSELQKRLTAELQERAREKAKITNSLPDGVEDSAYLKDTKKTTSLAWVWAVIVFCAICVILQLIIVSY